MSPLVLAAIALPNDYPSAVGEAYRGKNAQHHRRCLMPPDEYGSERENCRSDDCDRCTIGAYCPESLHRLIPRSQTGRLGTRSSHRSRSIVVAVLDVGTVLGLGQARTDAAG